jgi:hypothetical protein
MSFRFALDRFLVALALLGVLLAPLGPTLAAPMMKVQLRADMSADMTCCPDDDMQKPACNGECPFVALCNAAHAGLLVPTAIEAASRQSFDLRLLPGQDLPFLSRLADPPARPPRV